MSVWLVKPVWYWAIPTFTTGCRDSVTQQLPSEHDGNPRMRKWTTLTHQHNCKTLYFHFFKKNIQLNLCPSKVQHQSNKYSTTSTKCNFRKDGNHYISSATAIGTLQVNEVSTTRYCKCFVKKWRISVHWNARGLLMWNGYRNCGFVVQS